LFFGSRGLAHLSRVAIEVTIEPEALLRVHRRRCVLWRRLLLGPRLLLPKLRRRARERQLEVALLTPLHRAQLARIDDKLLARLAQPAQEGEALAIVRRAVEVAAQQEGAVALVVPTARDSSILTLPARLALRWRPPLLLCKRPCEYGRALAIRVAQLACPKAGEYGKWLNA